MTQLRATIAAPLPEASARIRYVARTHGWQLRESASSVDQLVFLRVPGPPLPVLLLRASRLVVLLSATTPTRTDALLTTGSPFLLTDWGRGARAARRVLADLAAWVDQEPGNGNESLASDR